jgi:hypothetical protein
MKLRERVKTIIQDEDFAALFSVVCQQFHLYQRYATADKNYEAEACYFRECISPTSPTLPADKKCPFTSQT